jgi:hypothetical protein
MIETPRIIFKYSSIYDQNWKEWMSLYKKAMPKFPSPGQILNYIGKMRRSWDREGKEILEEMTRVTGLKWNSRSIDCYVVGRCIPFSDPLTLPVYDRSQDDFIDTLIHELIHQYFTEDGNSKRLRKARDYFDRKYEGESPLTRTHIPLHALHSHIYLKFFNEKRLKRDIRCIDSPDYRKSWRIVQTEGYRNILREFTERTK